MTAEEVKKHIEAFQKSKLISQMREYYQYYNYKNTDLMRRTKERDERHKTPNWRVPTAYFATCVDNMAGYLFSDVEYASTDEAYLESFGSELDRNKLKVLDMKTGLGALIYNHAYNLVYTVGNGEATADTHIKVAPISPLSVVPIYDDTIERNLVSAIWFREDGDVMLADVYDATWHQQFAKQKNSEEFVEIAEPVEHGFGRCPVVEFNAEIVGDTSPFQAVLNYLPALDWAMTGNSNEIDRVLDALLVLGKKIRKEDTTHMQDWAIIDDISADETKPFFLTKDLSPDFRKYVTDLLINEIHKHSHVIDWYNAFTTGGDASAKALTLRLFDMDMFSKRIEMIYREGMANRIELVQNKMLELRGVQPQQISVKFNRTKPSQLDDMLTNLKSVDWISNQTKQEWCGLDSTNESERLRQEEPTIDI